jgi:hypothetical protein
MATAKKGNGTAVRRRTKSAAEKQSAIKDVATATYESNGALAHNGNGAAAAGANGATTDTSIETIRMRAYELFLARGSTHGDDLADWLKAERELRGVRNP